MLVVTNFICDKRFGLLDTRQTGLGGEGTALCVAIPTIHGTSLSDLRTTAARLLAALIGQDHSPRSVKRVQNSEQIKVTK